MYLAENVDSSVGARGVFDWTGVEDDVRRPGKEALAVEGTVLGLVREGLVVRYPTEWGRPFGTCCRGRERPAWVRRVWESLTARARRYRWFRRGRNRRSRPHRKSSRYRWHETAAPSGNRLRRLLTIPNDILEILNHHFSYHLEKLIIKICFFNILNIIMLGDSEI